MINPLNSSPDHITATRFRIRNNDYLILTPIILRTPVSLYAYIMHKNRFKLS